MAIPNPSPQQRGDTSPSLARSAPPLAGFPDSALLPPRAEGDPRCMCNGGWEQRRAGPSAPATGTRHLQRAEFLAGASASGRPRFPVLPQARPSAPTTSQHHRERENGASAWGKSDFTAELRAYTPAPTQPQPNVREPNTSNHTPAAAGKLSAGHSHPPCASQRPEQTETCWFSFLPSSSLPVAQNKSGPKRVPLWPMQGKRAQVGVITNTEPCEEHDAEWQDGVQETPVGS
jgi:hypothetical protein